MIREGAWWDIVDDVASNLIGEILRKNPKKMWKVLDSWNKDKHLWIRRASIICQLKLKQETNVPKLF